MGIQRFGSRMKDYATKVSLGSAGSAIHSFAVIDGPGLAHYIYYGLCDSAFSAITYRDCANATTAWLDKLQSYGFRIDAILFDGALPPSKKDVRIDRLQNYIARLLAYKQSSTTSLSSFNGQAKKGLPPPPFLVFAVVEELLRDARYADTTYIVPGEADPYCVAAASALPANDGVTITIFSDDSDLLVYEADSRTRIVPFRDLTESQVASKTLLQGDEYRPAEIASRGGGSNKDLIKAAYCMSLDYHCSLEKAFRLTASSNVTQREDFLAFSQLFETADEMQELRRIRADQQVKEVFASRDSRVSELVYQLRSTTDGPLSGGLRMYLPFLSDDPTRTTAWTVSSDVRLLAYSLLLQAHGCDSIVQEYRRSGTRVASFLLEPFTEAQISQYSEQLLSDLSAAIELARTEPRMSNEDGWRCLAMEQVLAYLRKEGLIMPALDEAVNTIMNREPRKWQLMHLTAQYQAAYYSLRILKQVLSHISDKTPKPMQLKSVAALHDQLGSLPRISLFLDDRAGANRRLEQETWRGVLPALLARYAADQGVDESAKKPSRSRKKAKKSHQSQPQDANLAKNPFAMLTD